MAEQTGIQQNILESAFNAAPMAMVLLDKNLQIQRANTLMEKLLGENSSKLINKSLGDSLQCLHLSDGPEGCGHGETCSQCGPRNAVEQVFQTAEPLYGIEVQPDLLMERKQFSPWLEVSITPMENDGKMYVILAMQDITNRKRTEEQLRIARNQAEFSSKTKGQFLANMSHDIRTPMNAIIGFSDILADENLTGEQQFYVDTIRTSGKHLLQLINDILDFSKIEAGKLDIDKSHTSLGRLFATVEAMMQPIASKKKNLNFAIRVVDTLPANIYTDQHRLQQCLINLISNAIKFTDTGHVHVNVYTDEIDSQLYVCFDVEDTGIGIAPEKQQQIFESFTQADRCTVHKYGGTGLGLAITQKLAKLLGGSLTLASQRSKGSTFSLVIPAASDVTTRPLPDNYRNNLSEESHHHKQPATLAGLPIT